VRLALFDDYRLGVVDGDEIRDVSEPVPGRDVAWPWPWLPRLVAAFADVRPRLEAAARRAQPRRLGSVGLLPPIPWPPQIVAAAATYHEHAREMAPRPDSSAGAVGREMGLSA